MPEDYTKQIKVDYMVCAGTADETILQVTLDHNIDLVVMGMTGKTDAVSKLFGSTSQEVLAKSDCPVLAIPSKAKFAGIDNIVYAVNFEFRDLEAINYLKTWTKSLDAPLHCLHILEAQEEPLTIFKQMHILRDTYRGQKRFEFDIKKGSFEEDIEAFALTKRADVIALITHKRHFLSRLSNKKTVHIPWRTPLLLLKDNAYQWDDRIEGWMQLVNAIA